MTNEKLAEYVHDKLLILRNIQTLISRPDFLLLYSECSEKEQQKVASYINSIDHIGLKKWFHDKRSSVLEILGMRELRKIASRLSISGYINLPKALLLSAITQKRKANEKPLNSMAS